MTKASDKPRQKIRLVNHKADLVHEDTIPVFNENPIVIIWGDRVFKRAYVDINLHGKIEVYSECFYYALP